VIKRYLENIDEAIASSSSVLSSNTQKHFSPDGKTVYLKGRLVFVDSSILEIGMFITESHQALAIEKYRLHYMDTNGRMLFRYDNAPHHPEMSSHPNHKHIFDKAIESTIPLLKEVLNEISAIIIGKPHSKNLKWRISFRSP
jgi:hypothetical protein